MKMKKLLISTLILLLSFVPYFSNGQSYTCKFIAEISIISVEKGAFLACTKSANPTACSIALAAHTCGETLACDGIVKEITEVGCNYTVKFIDNKIKIIGESTSEKAFEFKQVWEALNTVEGIDWLEKKILGF